MQRSTKWFILATMIFITLVFAAAIVVGLLYPGVIIWENIRSLSDVVGLLKILAIPIIAVLVLLAALKGATRRHRRERRYEYRVRRFWDATRRR